MRKYVWLNLNTGDFSNSWQASDLTNEILADAHTIEQARENGYKLIEYIVLNDNNFEFYNKMKIVTNTKN